MSTTNLPMAPRRRFPISHQRGTAAVEFAILALLFFTCVFGIIELCRIMYMYNTAAEVTRSAAAAAANTNFQDPTALSQIRQKSVFRKTPGPLPFGDPIDDAKVRIDYLSIQKVGESLSMKEVTSLPACPARNRQNCLENQYGDQCIRLVRVRICKATSGTCERLKYKMLLPLINLGVSLPTSTTIVQAESLGYHTGDALCD